jgi:putative ABC transport system permease protein
MSSRHFRDAVRFLSKSPGFTVTALLILAIGIGANTAMFSFVNALLLQPMPFPDPDRLVRIESVKGGVAGKLMPREWEELDRDTATFDGVAGWYPSQYNLTADGRPAVVRACMTTANLFRVLGVDLSLGASWQEGTHRQRNPVVVLSHELWKNGLGAQSSILRQTITLDGAPYMVVGVTSPGFQFPTRNDVYRAANLGGAQNEDVRSLFVVARLRPGVTLEQARGRLAAFAAEQGRRYPDSNREITLRVTPLRDAYIGDIRPYLLLTLALAAVVLLIASANIANLLLARGISRAREIAIRTALGAGSREIVAQLLVESVLLNFLGGLLGIGVAVAALRSLRVLVRADLPPWMEVRIDGTVLLFTLIVAVVCGVVAGLYPAIAASQSDTQRALREGSRGAGGSRVQGRIRQALIAGETGLAVVLLIASGLLVRSFASLQALDTGFNRSQMVTFRTDPPWSRYNKPEQTSVFYRTALEKLRTTPGIAAAAANHSFPLALNQNYGKPTIMLEGQSVDEQRMNPFVNVQIVSPNYLDMMGIPLLSGRSFSPDDRVGTSPVAVLSRPLASRLFGNADAVGRRVRLPELLSSLEDKDAQWLTVVGVAEGVRSEALTSSPAMDIYLSNQQQFAGDTFFILRTSEPLHVVTRLAEDAIRHVDPEQPIFAVQGVDELVDETVWQRRIAGQLSSCFGAVAVLLAAMGTYSLLSWTVTQRGRELAIRQALGSTPAGVRKLVISQGMRVAAIGILAGVCVALPLASAFSGLLFGVSPWDPPTLVFAVGFTAGVALLASYIPALRASRVNPNDALKAE